MGLSLKQLKEEVEVLTEHMDLLRSDLKKLRESSEDFAISSHKTFNRFTTEIIELKDDRRLIDLRRAINADLREMETLRSDILLERYAPNHLSLFNSICIVIVGISQVVHIFWGH